MQHIVFFDGKCPLCHRAVRFILQHDKKQCFSFSPLSGETAMRELASLQPLPDSLVLLQNFGQENERALVGGQAVLRILWILGSMWAWLGIFSFLPGFLFNWGYHLIARYRYRLFKTKVPLTLEPDRLLP